MQLVLQRSRHSLWFARRRVSEPFCEHSLLVSAGVQICFWRHLIWSQSIPASQNTIFGNGGELAVGTGSYSSHFIRNKMSSLLWSVPLS